MSALRTLALAGLTGFVLAVGCAERPRSDRPPVRQTTQALSATPIAGASLAAQQLVLTFDGGPSETTSELATWLRNLPTRVRATFFVDGACIAATELSPNESGCEVPLLDANAILEQLAAEGHRVANHTTTARNLVTDVPDAERVQEVAATDALILPHGRWDRLFLRPPEGAWDATVRGTLAASTMTKYVGPIGADIGNGPTTEERASDVECWQLGLTTRECGDRYVAEARAVGRGILLVHDGAGDVANHDLDVAPGNSADLVKYIVPILQNEFTFRSLEEVPAVAAALPKCHPSCTLCRGPGVSDCGSCADNFFVDGSVCSSCTTCAAGTFQSTACTEDADAVCVPCPVGTYSADGARECAACAEGTFADAPGSSRCKECSGCDDGDPCTRDDCAPTTGCTHEPIDRCEDKGVKDAPPGADGGAKQDPPTQDGGCSAAERPPNGGRFALAALLLLSIARRRRARSP